MGHVIERKPSDPRDLQRALEMVDAHNAYSKAHYRLTRDRSIKARFRRWWRRVKRDMMLAEPIVFWPYHHGD